MLSKSVAAVLVPKFKLLLFCEIRTIGVTTAVTETAPTKNGIKIFFQVFKVFALFFITISL
jgi:hypothetical protein